MDFKQTTTNKERNEVESMNSSIQSSGCIHEMPRVNRSEKKRLKGKEKNPFTYHVVCDYRQRQ